MTSLAMVQVFFRSFFLQALWNFERMQNIGFAFTIEPLLRRAYRAKDSFYSALRRHTDYFNTHPYLAPIVIGAVYHKEKILAETKRTEDATLTVLKNSMGAAFGAVGDHVIWGTWRPFCAIMALSVGPLVGYPSTTGNATQSIFSTSAGADFFAPSGGWSDSCRCLIQSISGSAGAACRKPLPMDRWSFSGFNRCIFRNGRRRSGASDLLFLFTMILIYFARWTASEMLLWMIAVLLGSAIMRRWGVSTFFMFYLVCGISVIMAQISEIHWP